MIEKLF